ncbi:MAG: rhomboid family intramembrane serine protease [Pseudomonadales bacterium]
MSSPDEHFTTCISRSRARGPVAELGLVLMAVAIDHEIDFDGYEWCLRVREADVRAARDELASYRFENQPEPSAPPHVHTFDSGWLGVFGFLLVIWALPTLEGLGAFGLDWREAGVMHAERVTDGEWWRTITALTLHGDIAHLVGNSLFGAVFGLFVGRYVGSGAGWLMVLLAAGLGNGLNALIQADGFRSVGASTATFAALALGATFVWRRGYMRGWGWRRRFAPLFGGIALLAFTGFGGENTDIMAHLTGFGFGTLMGVLAASVDLRRLGVSGQVLCGAAAFGLVWWAWSLAGAAARAVGV